MRTGQNVRIVGLKLDLRIVGIDPGVKTGFAEWIIPSTGQGVLRHVDTLRIDQAMARIICSPVPALVVFEDARKRKFFNAERDARQRLKPGVREGVGSVKRDCGIWEDFLRAQNIPFVAQPPKVGMTKRTHEQFERMTGWSGRTSEHARDAAMLVWGLTTSHIQRFVAR